MKIHDRMVEITGEPIAQGMSREIYACPDAPDVLLKVAKPMPPPRRFFQRFRLLAALRRHYKQVVPFVRECREYKRALGEGARAQASATAQGRGADRSRACHDRSRHQGQG